MSSYVSDFQTDVKKIFYMYCLPFTHCMTGLERENSSRVVALFARYETSHQPR